MKCSICGKDISPILDPATREVVWDQGNNAEPVNDGRCCDICDGLVVLPRRIEMAMDKSRWNQFIQHRLISRRQTNSD